MNSMSLEYYILSLSELVFIKTKWEHTDLSTPTRSAVQFKDTNVSCLHEDTIRNAVTQDINRYLGNYVV